MANKAEQFLGSVGASSEKDQRLLSSSRRISVFRALQLGDMLCAVPALRALRHAAPQATITLIGLPWARDFAVRYAHLIDDFLAFPGFPGFPEQPVSLRELPGFLNAVQRRNFDLVIQMHGSGGISNPLAAAIGGRRNAGYFVEGQYCPEPPNFLAWRDGEHEVLRTLRLMRNLGATPQGDHLEFPLRAADWQSLQHTSRHSGLALPSRGSYVCVHAGSRLPSRRWPVMRFAELADRFADQGMTIVLTGSAEEKEIAQQVTRHMCAPVLDLTGHTDLGALAALVSEAALVVCNDTGMSHIAAAVNTPSVVISSGADPARFAPLDTQRHTVLYADMPCRPCMHFSCPLPDHPCARAVSVDDAWRAATELLGARDAPVPQQRSPAAVWRLRQSARGVGG
ncbi:MAG: ADP-heptose--lipooligosaccharide heptosyltransferase [Herminiimonas sp.]|nr:ADP-heptose--lipooligosaccharide heptosyltransferase [Herminiimonas sp.]